MNLLTYILAKRNFLDQIKHEFQEIIDSFVEVIEMLKDLTYGNLEKFVGPDIALMLVIGIGAIIVMIVSLKIINR